jgi:hypothetical protein
MKTITAYIVFLFMCMQGQAQVPRSEKMILIDTRLYREGRAKEYNTLEVLDTVKKQVHCFKIIAESPKGLTPAYDIDGTFLYAVSVTEFMPWQYSISLVKLNVEKLDLLQHQDTTGVQKVKIFSSQSFVSNTQINSLSDAFHDAQLHGWKINYGLVVSAGGIVELYILLHDQLTIWQLAGGEWKKSYTGTCPFSGSFFAFVHKTKKYVIADTGALFEIGKTITEVLERKAGEHATLVVDKTHDRVYSLSGVKKTAKLQDVDTRKGIALF